MSAAQLEARRKAGLSTSNPTHACSGAISNAKPDCGEKRDPDKRSLIIQKKENELDPDTQLEKRSFAACALILQRTTGTVVDLPSTSELVSADNNEPIFLGRRKKRCEGGDRQLHLP
jgi:hypothetical protein